MNRLLVVGIALLCSISLTGTATALEDTAREDIEKHPACRYCGMDRLKFAHSRVLIDYDDGTSEGLCSIHCAAVDLALNIDKTPTAILVADFNTGKLIDAEKAFWVMGGGKMGVMTKNAKWAFGSKAGAAAFIKANGGTQATFDEVMKASYEDMYADTKMIREKRRMKRKMQPAKHN